MGDTDEYLIVDSSGDNHTSMYDNADAEGRGKGARLLFYESRALCLFEASTFSDPCPFFSNHYDCISFHHSRCCQSDVHQQW